MRKLAPSRAGAAILLLGAIATPGIGFGLSLTQENTAPQTKATSAADQVRSSFHIRYVNENEIYIDGGRDAGLAEGSQLELRKPFKAGEERQDNDFNNTAASNVLAHLTVVSVATNSAVCEVHDTTRPLTTDDVVYLAQADVEKLIEKQSLGNTRVYPMTVSFTTGDPLDEEVREAVPQPPIPEINQIRGRLGFDLSQIQGLGSNSFNTNAYGMVVRLDATRLFGTHWNINGFWRGYFQNSTATTATTLQDLIDRTYEMSLTYVNPQAHWTAGVGRLYLPWATSLDAIDGGYYAHNLARKTIAGIFAGSTPDPTAWNYNPQNKIGGLFLNTHGGDFDSFRYSFTLGGGVEMYNWSVNNPYGFTETTLSYKRSFTLYHAMRIDEPLANPGTPNVSPGLGQSLFTMQVMAGRRVSLELNHTYFRDVPTYDPTLVGTGLLDKYLFQGFSGGARFELPRHITTYFTIGQSHASTDTSSSSNYQFGATMSNIWKTGLTADARYSKFNSTFAGGTYNTFTLSRSITDRLSMNVQGGKWMYTGASLTTNTASWFGTATLDTNLGPHYFFETSFTTQRGGNMDYNQWFNSIGYRFDNRAKKRMNVLAAHK